MTEAKSLLTARDLGLDLEGMQLSLDPDRGVARLAVDRAEKLNTIPMPMRDQIADVFRVLEQDGRARVVVLRNTGETFSSGGDIPGFLAAHPKQVSLLHQNVAAAERFPGPVIAAIDGYCFGVGLEIAAACDFRIATTRAVFACPEIRLGMIPGSGGSQRLPRLVGMTRAKEMILRSRRVGATEALDWGLVSQVVEPGELDSAADRLADELLAFSRLAMETAKRVLNLGQDIPLTGGLQLEGYAYGMLRGTHDFAEGVHAFVEKRKPEFRGE